MVVKVRLEGLNITRDRSGRKLYVYHRDTGQCLLRGFEGTRADLDRRLAEPDILAAYNRLQKRDLKHSYPADTLGGLVQWFENDCPKYQKLADATKKDYSAAFLYLREEFDAPLSTITQTALYETLDRCAARKWPRFADKMMSALSSMFTQAVKRGKMTSNPAKGIDKVHKADPNSNREWARRMGGCDSAGTARDRDSADARPSCRVSRPDHRGATMETLPARSALQKVLPPRGQEKRRADLDPSDAGAAAFLDALDRTSLNIATRADGTPWDDEKQMQTAVSHFLRGIEATSAVEPGATLHGLRVSYAAELGRDGVSNSDVAAALGDRSERMGKHYTRHVENESKVVRAFASKRGKDNS